VLLLRLLLGLEPDPRTQVLRSTARPPLPSWLGELSLLGVRAFGRSWDVHVEEHAVHVEEAG
jgi:hypothetical protein